ncbi:MAG: amidohydrolase [Deltaproteobacteria bacterium]|nr:amidohydrolase [Deltaproteobacteria bacterium]
MPVVDFHVHIGNSEEMKPWVVSYFENYGKESGAEEVADKNGRIDPCALVDLLKRNGVDYAVILAELSPITTGMVSNEQVAEFCKGRKELIPFANLNPYLSARLAEELERCVQGLAMKGVKLYPTYQQFYPNDRILYPLYAKAQELKIPVMVHTGSSLFRGSRMKYGDPVLLDDVAVDFPELTLIQVHSGRGFWYSSAFFLAQLHNHVYMEIAGLPPQNLLKYFPELEKNADKILFGSDWPGVPGIGNNIAAIRALPIRGETKRKILGENAAKILKIVSV